MKKSIMIALLAMLGGDKAFKLVKDDEGGEATDKEVNVYERYKPFKLDIENDEDKFVHDYRHAVALDKALNSNVTS